MGSFEKDIVFGEFEDLLCQDPDEHAKVFNILHGQTRQAPIKVEFPWDKDEDSEACGGSHEIPVKSWAEEEISFMDDRHMPVYQPTDMHSGITFGEVSAPFTDLGPYQGQRVLHQYNHNPYEGQGIAPAMMNTGLIDESEDFANQQSKLKSSLKPYERRNKKKRPPDYYKQTESFKEHGYPQHTMSAVPVPIIPTDFSVPPPGHPALFRAGPDPRITATNIGGPNVTLGPNGSNPNAFSVQPVIPPGNLLHNTQGGNIGMPVGMASFPDPRTMGHDPNHGARLPSQTPSPNVNYQSDELMEVVVDNSDKNVYNDSSVHIPDRTVSYQNQDHDRTRFEKNVVGANYASESSNSVNVLSHSDMFKNQEMSAVTNSNKDVGARVTRVDVSIKDAPFVESSSPVQTVQETNSIKGRQPIIQNEHVDNTTINQEVCEKCVGDEETTEAARDETNSANDEIGAKQSENLKNVKEILEPGLASEPAPKPEAPKLSSWASLFKGKTGNTAGDGQGLKSYREENTAENHGKEERPGLESPPCTVSAAEDSAAKDLGELISRMSISHGTVALQPRGLVNKGNWCYINGTLQALIACPPFYNLLRGLPRYPALSRGPSSTPILDSLVEFVHEFHPMSRNNADKGQPKGTRDITPGPSFEPTYVYRMLQVIAVNPHFKLGKQEDAEEFLSCILDGMHEEMSAAVNLNCQSEHTDDEQGEEGQTNGFVAADEPADEDAWEQVGPKKKSVFTRTANFSKSPIADIFAGILRSAVYKTSAKETATLQPFFTLQLDIQSERVWSVQDALEELVSKEQISGYTCPSTNAEVDVSKKLSLEELPPVLILHLKCFVYNKDGGSQKLMKKVDYKVELEITKDLLSPNARNKLSIQQRSYKLFAVVYHHGKKSTGGGHYTTNVFHPGITGWVNFDDSNVKTVTVNQVLRYAPPRVPYLLYYRRLDSQRD
ncbi:ubiquitin carboxyl-terminal hydrolase 10-like [Mya arenaria]|uniref:ubiquitin carboxyl-terminal hydrolase 10-like n=1 Tax=Mya arenaria TaxID=6604 RepID=UPI0022E69013|nr:ubiquitin carboxyl-terminal hydrolase 10-like [Mya arenaria]